MPKKNRLKLVDGVGINDSESVIYSLVEGKLTFCPFYQKWRNLLIRCYSKSYQSRKPAYLGCVVDESWHRFSVFRKWMESQDWKGKDLDKDLLGDGKLYSKDTCVFISHAVNSFISNVGRSHNGLPIGVSLFRNGKFKASIRWNGSLKHLGYFDTPQLAHLAWRREKAAQAIEMAKSEPDKRVSDGLMNYSKRLLARAHEEKTEILIEAIQ